MTEIQEEIRERLFELQDPQYRDFQTKLMPEVDPETVIGVRTPPLRKLAREYAKHPKAAEFLNTLPHAYYEENNLHGFLLETIGDYSLAVSRVEKFLPYINNWATCDMMCPKVFGEHLPELLEKIRIWLRTEDTYTVRFAIGMLMRFYLDDAFRSEYPEMVAEVRSGEYYINMMVAWYFATALAKQYEAVLPYLTGRRLSPWTHNKAIQKAVESRRITEEQKTYLRTLRVSRRNK